jgi:uncharacterized pyridoxamine 5'-phosphate oxidase family protein
MKEAVKFLRECKVFFMSTVCDDKPHTRPFGAVMGGKDCVYVSTGKNRNTYHHITLNPNVCITAIIPDTRNWIRIVGKAVEESSLELKRQMMHENHILKHRYHGIDDPNFALIKIEVEKCEISE